MNKIKKKFLSSGDTFMPEMNSREPEFTCSTCGPFTKNVNHFHLRCIYQNKLDKACL